MLNGGMQERAAGSLVKGAVVYFSIAEDNDHGKLAAAFSKVGFLDALPTGRTPYAAMKTTLEALFADNSYRRKQRYDVQRVPGENDALAVVELPNEGADVGSKWGEVVVLASYDQKDGWTIAVNVGLPHDETVIRDRYQREVNRLPGQSVGNAIVKVLHRLRAVTLRDSGGIYWLPASKLETISELAEGIKDAALTEGAVNSIYALHTQLDEHSAGAVIAALQAEVKAQCDRIEAEIAAGDLGKRALETRQQDLFSIRAKVVEYEEILGVTLETMKERSRQIEILAAREALAEMGRQMELETAVP